MLKLAQNLERHDSEKRHTWHMWRLWETLHVY